MPAEPRYDFRGGISRHRRQTDQQVLLSQNLRPKADGSLETRKGRVLAATLGTSGNIYALYGRHDVTYGLQLFSLLNGASNNALFKNSTELTGDAIGASLVGSIAEYKETIFFTNGVAPIQYHVLGTSVYASITGTPTPPVGEHIIFYKDRCYVGTKTGEVHWSNALMFTTLPTCDFPALNFQIIGGTGDPVTGLALGQDFLVAFTDNAFHIMTGTPDDDGGAGDMSWQSFVGVGTRASGSIASKGKKIFFLGSNYRPYILDGSTLIDIDIEDKVQEYLTSISFSLMNRCKAAFYGNELWLYTPVNTDSLTGRILVYNTETQIWTIFTNINIGSICFVPDMGQLYAGSNNGTSIWNLESGDYDESALIPIDFISRQEVLGSFRKTKHYTFANIQADIKAGETLYIQYNLDNGAFVAAETNPTVTPTNTPATWGIGTWGVGTWGWFKLKNIFSRFKTNPKASGIELRLRVYGNVSAGTKILSYEVEGAVEPRDGEVI